MGERPETFLSGEESARLYQVRFDESARRRNAAIWCVLCRRFFQRYVPEDATVVDLGAGYCEFINHIRAARRIAVNTNPGPGGRGAGRGEWSRAISGRWKACPRPPPTSPLPATCWNTCRRRPT